MVVQSLGAWVEWARGQVASDGDVMVAIVGAEGAGKSTLAWHLARRLDASFDAERVQFSGPMYVRQAKGLRAGQAGVWDEVVEGGLRIEAMTRENREALKFMVTCRALNLFHLLCVPTLDILHRYAGDWRAQWFIDVERRGMARFYQAKRGARLPGARVYWAPRFRVPFGPVDDAEWTAYLERKDAWVRMDRDPQAAVQADVAASRLRRLEDATAWLPGMVRR